MDEFEKWLNRNWKDYSFTHWKKSFGQRLVGKHKGGWHTDRILLIYNCVNKPAIEDFVEFLKDFQKFHDQYRGDFEIDGAYFILRGEYDKKAFNLLLKNFDEELRDSVQIKVLEEKGLPNSKFDVREKAGKKKVFIVHGRDKGPALELARFIDKRYPIEAILLEEQAHRGRTLIEKLEDYSDVDFAFITLAPDDIGALKGQDLRERGRQNVIFELGQFIGKIGRKKVCLLIKGDVEIPSDLRGMGYYRFNNEIKECYIDIENELKDAKLLD